MISTGPEPGDVSGLVVAVIVGAGILLLVGLGVLLLLLRISRRSVGVAIVWGAWIYVCIPVVGLWLLFSGERGDAAFPHVLAVGILISLGLLAGSAVWLAGQAPRPGGVQRPRP